jgi:hypothetical protein
MSDNYLRQNGILVNQLAHVTSTYEQLQKSVKQNTGSLLDL